MLLILALAAAPSGLLPSFPCAQARTPHERMICANPELAAADAALGASYRRARAALSPVGRKQLARSQLAWLKFSRTVCPHDEPERRFQTPSECLQSEYEQRRREIDEAGRRLGPFTVLRLDSYALWPAPAGDEHGQHPGFYTDLNRRDWIDPTPLSGQLRHAALRWNAKAATPSRWVRHTHGREAASGEVYDEDERADTVHEITIVAASRDFISSDHRWHIYSHGSAHGYGWTHHALARTRDGKRIAPRALFSPGGGWLRHVAERSSRLLGSAASEGSIPEPLHWKFWAGGAARNFGEVFGYASGDQILTMSWSELGPHLSPLGRRVRRDFERGDSL